MERVFYQLTRPLIVLITRIIYNPKIYGKENIPKYDGIIFAGNHISAMDHLTVICATKRTVKFLTKSELYNGIIGLFLKLYGTIPVDRTKKDERCINLSKEALIKGNAINIFPEGKRNTTKDILLPFKYGAVSLAKKTNCWIVPYGINGVLKPFTRDVIVNFGKPFKVQDMELEKANEILKEKIIDLIKKGEQDYGN